MSIVVGGVELCCVSKQVTWLSRRCVYTSGIIGDVMFLCLILAVPTNQTLLNIELFPTRCNHKAGASIVTRVRLHSSIYSDLSTCDQLHHV